MARLQTSIAARQRMLPQIFLGLLAASVFASPPATRTSRTLELLLVDKASGAAVRGARVDAYANDGGQDLRSSAEGRAAVAVGENPADLEIFVHAPGYVPRVLSWNAAGDIPGAYCVKMEKGTHIGGRVMDDAGKPVAGAHVVIQLRDGEESLFSHDVNYAGYERVDSRADGTWSYDEAPAALEKGSIGVWDYRYANGDYFPMKDFAPEPLRDGSATVVLRRGVPVTGVVMGADAKPIAGASVLTGASMCSNRVPAEMTDQRGAFAYVARPDEMVTLTVSCQGYSPELVQFVMGPSAKHVAIQLQKAVAMMGRVVGPNGEPVPFAGIYPDTWRGARSLPDRIQADKDGRFQWDDAPRDTVLCDVDGTGQGYLREQDVALTASDKELVVHVRRGLQVSGTVVDADTGKPIGHFDIVRGNWQGSGEPIAWDRFEGHVMAGSGGKFQYSISWAQKGYVTRIEASGYLPAESRVFHAGEKNVALVFKMSKAADVTATVMDPDGKPATGARGALAATGENIYVNNGVISGMCQQTVVGSGGKMDFPPQQGDFKIIIFDRAGYFITDRQALSQLNRITLKAWAVVSGKLMIGSKAGRDKTVVIQPEVEHYDPKQPQVTIQTRMQTDQAGHFYFDRVPPGDMTIAREVELQFNPMVRVSVRADAQLLELSPGQVARVRLGGMGRPVTGRVIVPTELAKRSDWFFQLTEFSSAVPSRPAPPESIKNGTAEERKRWSADFEKTDAGKAYHNAIKEWELHQYPVQINPDGTWRADDVPAGSYELFFGAVKTQPAMAFDMGGEELAAGKCEFTVPAIPGGRGDKAFEAPTVSLTMDKNVEPGETAADFSLTTLEGKPFKLSALRGKYVLLDFWATWCAPCIEEMTNIKAVYDDFGTNPRLEIVSLSLDTAAGDARQYATRNGLAWTQLFIPGGFESPVIKNYGVRGIPSIWLIGPDGKVIARELRGDGIKAAVETALGAGTSRVN